MEKIERSKEKQSVSIPEPDALKTERDALIQDVISLMRDARLKLTELSGVEQELLSRYHIRSGDIFGTLPAVIEHLFTQRAYLDGCRAYFGIPPKPDKQVALVASAERALANIREMLKSAREKQKRSFTIKSGYPSITAEDIERLEMREQDAVETLERARGTLKEYQATQRAEARERREAERAGAVESVVSYQRGWREYAAKLRDNTSS